MNIRMADAARKREAATLRIVAAPTPRLSDAASAL
jgi:hypothetical protein